MSVQLLQNFHDFINKNQILSFTVRESKNFQNFMDGVQLSLGCRATTKRQFTFYHYVPSYSFDQPLKDERLSQSWSYQTVLQSKTLITHTTFFLQKNIMDPIMMCVFR